MILQLLDCAASPSKRGVFDAALMLRVPLWAGPSHVMKLGPIGIAGDLDQPVPPRHDHIQALAKAASLMGALDALAREFHVRVRGPRNAALRLLAVHIGALKSSDIVLQLFCE